MYRVHSVAGCTNFRPDPLARSISKSRLVIRETSSVHLKSVGRDANRFSSFSRLDTRPILVTKYSYIAPGSQQVSSIRKITPLLHNPRHHIVVVRVGNLGAVEGARDERLLRAEVVDVALCRRSPARAARYGPPTAVPSRRSRPRPARPLPCPPTRPCPRADLLLQLHQPRRRASMVRFGTFSAHPARTPPRPPRPSSRRRRANRTWLRDKLCRVR